jgi:hypothetical protein
MERESSNLLVCPRGLYGLRRSGERVGEDTRLT